MKNPTIYDEWAFLLPKIRANLATPGERERFEILGRRIVQPAVDRAVAQARAAAERQQQAQRQARAAAERARAQQLQPRGESPAQRLMREEIQRKQAQRPQRR